jgi:hypothetical protein
MKYLLDAKEISQALVDYVGARNFIAPGTKFTVELSADGESNEFSAIIYEKEEVDELNDLEG